jgi:hypothetical protein
VEADPDTFCRADGQAYGLTVDLFGEYAEKLDSEGP